jgi:hypothetical protein
MMTLRDGGMSVKNLHAVFSVLILNRHTYCVNVWRGFLTVEQVGRINAPLNVPDAVN